MVHGAFGRRRGSALAARGPRPGAGARGATGAGDAATSTGGGTLGAGPDPCTAKNPATPADATPASTAGTSQRRCGRATAVVAPTIWPTPAVVIASRGAVVRRISGAFVNSFL